MFFLWQSKSAYFKSNTLFDARPSPNTLDNLAEPETEPTLCSHSPNVLLQTLVFFGSSSLDQIEYLGLLEPDCNPISRDYGSGTSHDAGPIMSYPGLDVDQNGCFQRSRRGLGYFIPAHVQSKRFKIISQGLVQYVVQLWSLGTEIFTVLRCNRFWKGIYVDTFGTSQLQLKALGMPSGNRL
ncbi:MAG: hypothetical protein Q9187_001978 [Circinaria calcarea]